MSAPGRGDCGAPIRAGDPSACEGPARFAVRYSAGGRVLDEHRACFRHGLAEVERHRAANGSAVADLAELDPPPALAELVARARATQPVVTHDPVFDDYARRLRASGLDPRELDDLATCAVPAVDRGDVELARERIATALGDACAALGQLRGRGDRDELTVEQRRAARAGSLVHEALKVLAGERD